MPKRMPPHDSSDKDAPYCVVTGANAGLGKAITAGLMARGAHVVMACRNMAACEAAAAELASAAVPGSCICAQLDLADAASVRQFAAQQRATLQMSQRPLNVLVNNAGVMGLGPGPCGEDQHLAINHLGTFLLTTQLLPAMARGSRVVTVSSRAHRLGSVAVRDGVIMPGPTQWWCGAARWRVARSSCPDYVMGCMCSSFPVCHIQGYARC